MFSKKLPIAEFQLKSMNELLFTVSSADNILGFAPKLYCHTKSNHSPYGICHRAFSLFLFDKCNGDLLIQRRSFQKMTFPGLWSNTICSHPIVGKCMKELDGAIGIFRAVSRRFNIEMSYDIPAKVQQSLKCIGRVYYKADSSSEYCENEIDYIVIGEVNREDIFINKYNTDEIFEIEFISLNKLRAQITAKPLQFTPWFRKVIEQELIQNWSKMYNENMENMSRGDIIVL